MSNVTVYDFNEEPIRVTQDDAGQLWFVFRDAALALGYANPDKVKERIPSVNLTQREVENTRGQTRQTWCINLEGLNYLIFGSEKEEAEEFKKLAASIMAEFQTTGQVLPKEQPLLDLHQPVAHIVEDTRKTVSKTMNAVAHTLGGSTGARDVNIHASLIYFGLTPKQKRIAVEKEYGKKVTKTKSLPQALTENNIPVATGYSFFKHLLTTTGNTPCDQLKDIGHAVEVLATKLLAAGIDPKNALQ